MIRDTLQQRGWLQQQWLERHVSNKFPFLDGTICLLKRRPIASSKIIFVFGCYKRSNKNKWALFTMTHQRSFSTNKTHPHAVSLLQYHQMYKGGHMDGSGGPQVDCWVGCDCLRGLSFRARFTSQHCHISQRHTRATDMRSNVPKWERLKVTRKWQSIETEEMNEQARNVAKHAPWNLNFPCIFNMNRDAPAKRDTTSLQRPQSSVAVCCAVWSVVAWVECRTSKRATPIVFFFASRVCWSRR